MEFSLTMGNMIKIKNSKGKAFIGFFLLLAKSVRKMLSRKKINWTELKVDDKNMFNNIFQSYRLRFVLFRNRNFAYL